MVILPLFLIGALSGAGSDYYWTGTSVPPREALDLVVDAVASELRRDQPSPAFPVRGGIRLTSVPGDPGVDRIDCVEAARQDQNAQPCLRLDRSGHVIAFSYSSQPEARTYAYEVFLLPSDDVSVLDGPGRYEFPRVQIHFPYVDGSDALERVARAIEAGLRRAGARMRPRSR